MSLTWNKTYDVVVLGFGAAGATAARFAADTGAKVLLVDSAPEGHEGGNTRYCGQIIGFATDKAKMKQYYHQLQKPLDLDESMIDTYVDGFANMKQYIEKYFDVEPISVKSVMNSWGSMLKSMIPEYPEYKGAESYDTFVLTKGFFNGSLWKQLRKEVLSRKNITVWYQSPAKHLIKQDGKIAGVQIDHNHVITNIKANNGVVLATGGFENNQKMIQDYLGRDWLVPQGSIYNKGDGISMAEEVGADMWHMHNFESLGLTYRMPVGQRGPILFAWTAMANGSALVIGDDGTRYFNETEGHRHGHNYFHGTWMVPQPTTKPYLIFDKAQYQKIEGLKLGDQFEQMLISAGSIENLAIKIDIDPKVLTTTIQEFNEQIKLGKDYQFSRDINTMKPLEGREYYALPLKQSMLNTQGGPRRNDNAQVLDPSGKLIKHLYSAGELGGISANEYQGGNNIAECLIFGKIAGENAAMPKDGNPVYDKTEATTGAGAQEESTEGEYKVGKNQYIGRSDLGMGDELVVRVTYENHKISNVEVLKDSESSDYGKKALEQIPTRIVQANDTKVDAVTGASMTSRAIEDAVRNALEKVKK